MGFSLMMLSAKLLSIAGIGGLISGLFSRRIWVAITLGAAWGVADTVVLSAQWSSPVPAAAWVFAVVAGVGAALLGWLVKGRKRGATQQVHATQEQPRD